MEIRPVNNAEKDQARRLGAEAFGVPAPGAFVPAPPDPSAPGRSTWGAFDDDRLVAKAVGLDLGSWFGGAEVATCGVAGVAVAAEDRGRGLLRPVFTALTRDAASRGYCISTLFPSANGIYRSLGYEPVACFDTVELATARLMCADPVRTTTRRAQLADVPAIRAVYTAWASAQNGPLTRVGPPLADTDQELLDDVTAVTLATEGDQVTGYLAWRRGDSDLPDAVLTVDELVSVDADALRALWGVVRSFDSVSGSVRLATSGDDPARHVLRTASWDVVGRHSYSLRLLDLPGAVAARPATAPLAPDTVELGVSGDRLGLLDGCYRLTVGGTQLDCERIGPDASTDLPTFTAGGVGLLWAGSQSCANLRMLGHLTGPTGHDAVLDAAFGGRQLHIRDYF